MPQSLAKILVQIVFSTKKRAPFITEETEKELFPYQAAILREHKSNALIINGTPDHVHLLCTLPRTISLSKLLEEVKKSSSKWIKTKGARYREFAWQNGYGAFSISPSAVDRAKAYIAKQKEHHRTQTFQDEFRALPRHHQIDYDERYVWD